MTKHQDNINIYTVLYLFDCLLYEAESLYMTRSMSYRSSHHQYLGYVSVMF